MEKKNKRKKPINAVYLIVDTVIRPRGDDGRKNVLFVYEKISSEFQDGMAEVAVRISTRCAGISVGTLRLLVSSTAGRVMQKPLEKDKKKTTSEWKNELFL